MKNGLKRIFLLSSTAVFLSFGNIAYAAPKAQNTINFDNFIKSIRQNDLSGVRKSFNANFINAKDSSGRTPLSLALRNDNFEIASFLLSNGASPYFRNSNGNPTYCDAKGTTNKNIKSMFSKYDFEQCKSAIGFSNSTMITTGSILIAGGAVALAAGGGGGGGGSGSGASSTSASNNYTEYGLVGQVNSNTLNNILNSPDYSSGLRYGNKFYTNYDDYNQIRLAYSLARGLTGKVVSQGYTPGFMANLNAGDKVRVAVIDSGVAATHPNLATNVITGIQDSNLAAVVCSNNPGLIYCSGTNYVMGDATPYAYYNANNTSWHGTAVAGLIAGEFNGSGITGVAPDSDILPYRVTYNGGTFVSMGYIGVAFKSAAENGASVINNSWGINTKNSNNTPNINAGDITSKSQLYSIFKDNSYTSNVYNYIDQMLYAVTNYDTIFVWAAGNEGTSQSSVTTAIPLFFDEFKDGDYYKNFINVVAYDTEKDQLANYSNACGVTKNYCITAPGSDMVVTSYANGDTTNSGYMLVDGTSFATPLVSGAVATLKGAFPYLTGAEITKLIFVTARDLGAPGVDDIYGWGMLDLERATRPVGATTVPVDTRVDGRTFDATRSSLKLSSKIGNKIKQENLRYVYLDDFNRTFTASLNENIEIIKDRPRPIDVLNRFADNKIKPTILTKNNDLSFYSNKQVIGYNSDIANEFKVSYNDSNVNKSNYGFSFYYGNNPYNSFVGNDVDFYNGFTLSGTSNYNVLNPYFRNDSKENFSFNNEVFMNEQFSFNFGMVYQDYTLRTESEKFEGIRHDDLGSSMSLITKLNYSPTKNVKTSFEFGFMNEKNTLFASKTGGAFGLGNDNQTYFIGLQNDINLYQNKLYLLGKANFGMTKVNKADNSLIGDVSNLYTNSFAVGLNYNLINEKARKSNISFLVAQAVRVNSGSMSLRLPTSRDNDGNLYYDNHKISLKDKGNLEYQLAYSYETDDNSELNMGLIYSNYSDGYQDKNEGIFMLKYKKAF